jgi:hypothetical protein
MHSATLISLAARERLWDHQATTAKAVATFSAKLSRLDVVRARRTM